MKRSTSHRSYRQISAWAAAATLAVALTACESVESASDSEAKSSESSSHQQAGTSSSKQDTEDSALPADEQGTAASPMNAAFATGQSVVCTYTHEAYEATTTLRSMEVFRIDQQTQGGAAHVIRTSEETLTWIDGMTEAMLFDTEAYEQDTSGRYAMFDPSEFNNEALFTDGTCRAEPAVEDEIFELPADMSSAPAQP